MKLTAKQQELYDALKQGVVVHYMPYMGRFNPSAYYYRHDTHQKVTVAADALVKKGLAERYDEDWRGHKLRVSSPCPARQPILASPVRDS